MKISDIINEEYLKITDFENFLPVAVDEKKDNRYHYNLNTNLYLNIDDSALNIYIADFNMHWPLASYKIYGTTRFAWLLMKLNGVDAHNVFNIINAGDQIKYIADENIQPIIEVMNQDSE